MASKFKAGMINFVEVLNQMWDAFVVGPYNALSLAGGRVIGTLFVGSGVSASFLNPAPEQSSAAPGGLFEPFRLGVSQTPSNWPGFWSIQTSQGHGSQYKEGYKLHIRTYDSETANFTGSLFSIQGNGDVSAAGSLFASRISIGLGSNVAQSVIALDSAEEGMPILSMRYVADFNRTTTGFGSSAATAINVTRNSVTGRSINAYGTVNANGADYAEYLIKGLLCGTIAPGQIVGIDADGHLTDKWDLAISFAVKSTNPCIVGGDSWAVHLGQRPITPISPASPVRQDDVTDEQWAEVLSGAQAAQNEFQTALAAVQVAQQEFDIALEAARQTVDRIAFAGQVPVNLQGAAPGQFIVPVQDGAGIAGLAIDEADITLRQYMRAIGRVIAIEDDGRARIIVKVA